ncbi:hypothetical protein Tco_0868303 [Tanacetum coccineum]
MMHKFAKGPVEGQRTDNKKKMGSNHGNRLETPTRVPKWLDEVDEIIKKYVEDVQEGSNNFSNNDLGCSDVKKKYRAGRDAFKLTKDIKALIEESNKIIFDKPRAVEQEVQCRRREVEKEVRWKRRVVQEEVRWRRKVEFPRISLTGFRSCTSRSHYRSVSKQTTR